MADSNTPSNTPVPLPEKPWQDNEWLLEHRGQREWARSNRWYERCIEAYREWGNLTRCCKAAGVSRQTIHNRMRTDPEFAAAMEEAKEESADQFEEALRELGIEGEPYYKFNRETGEYVEVGRRKNIIAIIFALKALRPHIYRDNIKPDDRQDAKALAQLVVHFFKGFDASSDQQAMMPSFNDFLKGQAPAALPPPAETTEQRRARLLAELAALDAGEPTEYADD